MYYLRFKVDQHLIEEKKVFMYVGKFIEYVYYVVLAVLRAN
jgi:hypothetical protein